MSTLEVLRGLRAGLLERKVAGPSYPLTSSGSYTALIRELSVARSIGRALLLAPLVTPAVLLAAHAAPSMASFPLGRVLFPAVVRAGVDDAVALTFDDGPDRGLAAFLDLLEEHKARATFFVVGEQVERDPSRLQEIVACGHEVAVHCYQHQHHLRLTPRETMEDMRRAAAIVEEASGCANELYRPPYGVFNLWSWLEAGRQGWKRVLWTRWGRDWEEKATPSSIVDELGRPEAGDILLLHDSDRYAAPESWRNTLGALPMILEGIARQGFSACSVGELLNAERI